MKEILDQYARYNAWAHKKLLELINMLNKTQQHEEVASSFSSLYKTVLHIWGAETVWWRRLSQDNSQISGDPFSESMANLSIGLEQLDQQWMDWVLSRDENGLKEKLRYSNSRGDQFYQPIYQLVLHLFNHSTYHNGQLVTILRQLKIEKIPQTDFIAWTRQV